MTTVVLLPITVDLDLAADVVPDFAVQLEEVLPEAVPLEAVSLEVVLLPPVVLFVEPPLHAAARSASTAIAPSTGNRRKIEDIRKGPLLYQDQFSQDRRCTGVRMPWRASRRAPSCPDAPADRRSSAPLVRRAHIRHFARLGRILRQFASNCSCIRARPDASSPSIRSCHVSRPNSEHRLWYRSALLAVLPTGGEAACLPTGRLLHSVFTSWSDQDPASCCCGCPP